MKTLGKIYMSENEFTQLGLSAELVKGVAYAGYTQPTPIQAQAIPLILERKDLIAEAKQGREKRLVLDCRYYRG